MWTLYILECRDRSLYTGIALKIERRLKEHFLGKGSKYVRSRLPFKLVYREKLKNKSLALKREAEIKAWTKSKKKALVANGKPSRVFFL